MVLRALPVTAFCFLLLSAAYLVGTLDLPMGSAVKPGAGLFPLLVGISLAGLSLALLLASLKRRGGRLHDQESFPEGSDRRRVVILAMTLAGFVILLKPLGYAAASALLMAAVLRILGLRSWAKIILISVVTSAISFFLFDSLLGTPLPRGIFFS